MRGFSKNGVNVFLGIPYAAPPVGDLRSRPLAPAGTWDDTRDAAPTCSQVTEFGASAGPSSVTEDCLYLNVFTTGSAGTKKPVSPRGNEAFVVSTVTHGAYHECQ